MSQSQVVIICFLIGVSLTSVGLAQSSLHHTTGLIDVGITDFGSLSGGLVGDVLMANCWYPIGTNEAAPYLHAFSEIWCGDSTGHVASALDLTEDSNLQLGEWVAVQNPIYLTDGRIRQEILTQYAPAPDSQLPFDILVDQISYTWNLQKVPDAAEIVILRFLLTNRQNLDAEGIFFAVATNWDIDTVDPDQLNPNTDLVEWYIPGQASVTFDGEPDDGIVPVQAALVLIHGKFRAHRILNTNDWDYSDAARSEVMAPADFVVDTSSSLPLASDYLSVISVGPYNIGPRQSKSVTYALVLGQDQQSLIRNITRSHQLALGATQLRAEGSDQQVLLKWEPAIAQKTFGYQVLRGVSPDGELAPLGRPVFNRSTYEDRDVVNGQTYYYQLLSLDAVGNPVVAVGMPIVSGIVKATPGRRPSAPIGLTYQITRQGIALHWQTASSAISYQVLRNETGASPWTAIGTTEQTRYVDINPVDGVPHYYSVIAIDASGHKSEPSESVQLTPAEPVVSEDFDDLEQVVIWPNPFSRRTGDQIVFRGLTPQATISIYSVSGQLVRRIEHENGTSRQTWDGRNGHGDKIPDGIYIYHVTAVHPGRGSITTQGILSIVP